MRTYGEIVMKIGVIGLGRIGLPLALVLSKEFKVIGVDIDENRVDYIRKNKHFAEPHVNEYIERYKHNFTPTDSYSLLKECDPVFIMVNTPSLPTGEFDLRYVISALKNLHSINPGCLAVISSTINIGDTEKLRKIHSRVCYNPEFIAQGRIISDFENPKFVAIGAYNERDAHEVIGVWNRIHSRPKIILKPVEAEILKLLLNVRLSLDITWANVVGDVCERFDADPRLILEIMNKDVRLYYPGLGFGGPCFPRDVRCLESFCSKNEIASGYKLASLLNELNEDIIQKYCNLIEGFGRKKVGIIGITYKPGVPYIDGSHPLAIAKRLMDLGYELHIYDPLVERKVHSVLDGKNVTFHSDLAECIRESEVVFLGHPMELSREQLSGKIVVDPWSGVQ